jgi:hypothetical protein
MRKASAGGTERSLDGRGKGSTVGVWLVALLDGSLDRRYDLRSVRTLSLFYEHQLQRICRRRPDVEGRHFAFPVAR